MKRRRISDWPEVRVNLNPRTLERIEDVADSRALSVAAVVREALEASFRPLNDLRSPLGAQGK